ncbi:hypothetical protein [Streptomyces mirabilis]|uniref:hypothetical protein n=1 Tax=Streptomyces mirabilis TaxID=68239 RepID=UPI003F4CB43D
MGQPFSEPTEAQFGKLVALVRCRGGDRQPGRSCRLPLADQVLLVAASWGTNLASSQMVPVFGTSKSATDRVLDRVAASSKNHRHSLQPAGRHHAAGRLVVVTGAPIYGHLAW